jgi:hypothetical protein
MPYMRRIVKAGRVIEYKKMQLSRIKIAGITWTRAAAEQPTTEAQEEANERKAEENMRWRINANFDEGDYHVTVHYRDKPQTFDKVLTDLQRFKEALRKDCKKRGVTLKYIAWTETKSMTRPHHHILLNQMDIRIIRDAWKSVVPTGHISFVPLDDRGNHEQLASYAIKESRSTMRRYTEATGKRGKRFTCSQNLVKPVAKYERVPASSWRDEPKPRKGYNLYKFDEGGTTQQGVTDTGYPWQLYYEIKRE